MLAYWGVYAGVRFGSGETRNRIDTLGSEGAWSLLLSHHCSLFLRGKRKEGCLAENGGMKFRKTARSLGVPPEGRDQTAVNSEKLAGHKREGSRKEAVGVARIPGR